MRFKVLELDEILHLASASVAPSGLISLIPADPGAARCALAPGYLYAAPAALSIPDLLGPSRETALDTGAIAGARLALPNLGTAPSKPSKKESELYPRQNVK